MPVLRVETGVGLWREAHARMLSWLVPQVTRSSAARRAARGWS